MDPAAAVLHYAQEVFEGLKAYRTADGGATLFRPRQNARRFQNSAERLAMPILPEEAFLDAVDELVSIDRALDPGRRRQPLPSALHVRHEIFLGVKPVVRIPVHRHRLVGRRLLQVGAPAVSGLGFTDYKRAAPGGTGAAKCGGNYAASLLAQAEATRHGCDQVVFLDAVEQRGSRSWAA